MGKFANVQILHRYALKRIKVPLIKFKMEIILMRSNAKLLNLSFLSKKCKATKIHVNMED